MTTLRTAAQQALEALEALQGGCTDSNDGTVEAITVWCPEIIDALRAALAEPSVEPVKQCMAEPVAFVNADNLQGLTLGHYGYVEIYTYESAGSVPLYTAPPQRPAELVGIVSSLVKGGVVWQRWPADMPDGTRLFSEVQP